MTEDFDCIKILCGSICAAAIEQALWDYQLVINAYDYKKTVTTAAEKDKCQKYIDAAIEDFNARMDFIGSEFWKLSTTVDPNHVKDLLEKKILEIREHKVRIHNCKTKVHY